MDTSNSSINGVKAVLGLKVAQAKQPEQYAAALVKMLRMLPGLRYWAMVATARDPMPNLCYMSPAAQASLDAMDAYFTVSLCQICVGALHTTRISD